ncbi:MAG: TRAP transporter small permease [Alphaproteobacteria bacterium]|nr:TRAP transporter small permease [Alphaproteobacteria bacterium]
MPVFEKAYCGLVTALAILAGAVLAAITTALVVNVVLVSVFTTNIFGMADGIEVGLMSVTFLAAPWVLQKNAHVAVDIVTANLTPRIQRPLNIFAMGLGALMSGILAWSSFQALLIALNRGSMIQGILVFPEWMVMVPASLAGVLLAIEFIRQAIHNPTLDRLQTGL